MQDPVRLVVLRGGHEQTQHRQRQCEYRNTRPQGSQSGSFFRQDHLHLRGKPDINQKQKKAPRGQMSQNMGVRKGLWIPGSVKRRTKMPMHTIAKASRVPMETSSPSKPIGNSPAMSVAIAPVRIVASQGVR